MKKIYLMSICVGAALVLASCNDEVELSSHEYDTVVTFKQEEMITFNFYNVDWDVTQTISINKGGYAVGTEPTVTLMSYTEEELTTYNEENNTHYKLVPAGQYTLSETSYKFGAAENFKSIDVTIKGSFAELASQGGDYILPIHLKTDRGMVNENKSVVYLKPNFVTPTVFANNELLTHVTIDANESESLTRYFNYDFYLDATNEWNFSLQLETDEDALDAAVSAFNAANGVNYTLLPSFAYTELEPIVFTPGVSDNYLPITIDVEGVDEGDYLLPIVPIGIEGAKFNAPEAMYIHVFVYNSGQLAPIDLNGRVTASSIHTSEGAIEHLWDNKTNTKWHSRWDANELYDSKYGIYLDINLNNKPLNTQVQFGYTTRGNDNNNVPYMIQVYGGTSKDDLRLIAELDYDKGDQLPQEKATAYASGIFSLGGTTTKLIRISFCKAYDYSYGWGLDDLRKGKIVGSSGTIHYPSVCISELNLSGK